jgi:hypothetical protein
MNPEFFYPAASIQMLPLMQSTVDVPSKLILFGGLADNDCSFVS